MDWGQHERAQTLRLDKSALQKRVVVKANLFDATDKQDVIPTGLAR